MIKIVGLKKLSGNLGIQLALLILRHKIQSQVEVFLIGINAGM